MENKTFIEENRWWIIFTIAIILGGALMLYYQEYFREEQSRISPLVYREMELKMLFEEGEPKLVAYAPEFRIVWIPTLVGESVPKIDSMVLGFEEARMMAINRNISASEALWGYQVDSFFGQSFNVAGTLKKTNSMIDMMHFVSKDSYYKLPTGQKIGIKLTGDKMPKFFYTVDFESQNLPQGFSYLEKVEGELRPLSKEKSYINSNILGFDIKFAEKKNYLPVVLGFEEASMMKKENLFKKPGDLIENFFGKDVYIAGILNPTNTSLDMMHYVPVELG